MGTASLALEPSRVGTLSELRRLTNEEARKRTPVSFTGTVTYVRANDHALVVQDGSDAIYVRATTDARLVPGDRVRVRGTTEGSFFWPIVVSHNVVVLYHAQPPTPIATTLESLSDLAALTGSTSSAGNDTTSGIHNFDLVSVEGTLVTQTEDQAQEVFVISSQGHLISAVLRQSSIDEGNTGRPSPPLLAAGTNISATGIAIPNAGDRFDRGIAFELLLRSASDVKIISKSSLSSARPVMLVVGIFFLMLGGSVWALERQVRRQVPSTAAQTKTDPQLERLRSAILEDISGPKPLAEIIGQITEYVSLTLGSPPCWCQVSGGSRLGNCPDRIDSMRVVSSQILSRYGQPLGEFFVGFDRESLPSPEQTAALCVGTQLAALAINTRRLSSDLQRKSEFDPLTEIHNRLSFDKYFSERIEQAGQTADSFGLIYIDLDDFKQVNDIYGHVVGDAYLREVSVRMKRQVRPDDMLARIGGDEFAAILPIVRSRTDVEEVAHRLAGSLKAPFELESCVIYGAASFGVAVFPEDGTTREELMHAADAQMYVAKRARKHADTFPAQRRA